LSRGMIGRDGNVRFRIDVKKILDSARGGDRTEQMKMELVKLKFSHLDTSVVLELRLPIDDMNGDSAECNIDFGVAESNDKNHSSRFLLDDKDEEEEQMPNDYEDDGFIVDDSDEESNEGAESDNDDCELCHNGGDLLVCDGGDYGGGCGKSYHVECIKRESIPEGEWICKACASTLGLKTGIEGHEWEAEEVEEKEEEDQSAPREEDKGNALVDSDDEDNSNVVDLVDSDDEEAVPVRRKKRRKVLEDSGSDDE